MSAAHLSDGFYDLALEGYDCATCICGWRSAPLPDVDSAVDALMEHAAERATAESDGIARRLADALLREAVTTHVKHSRGSIDICTYPRCVDVLALLAEYEGRAEK